MTHIFRLLGTVGEKKFKVKKHTKINKYKVQQNTFKREEN